MLTIIKMLISAPTVKFYPSKLLALKRMLTKYTFEHPIRIPWRHHLLGDPIYWNEIILGIFFPSLEQFQRSFWLVLFGSQYGQGQSE
jgi:hypothetical protein